MSPKRLAEIRYWHANIAPACSQTYVGDLLRGYDALLLIAKRQFQCLRPIRDAGKDCQCAVCEALRDEV